MRVDGVPVDSEIAKIAKHAESQGWTVRATTSARLQFCSPDKSVRPVFVPQRVEPGRALANTLALLARAGLDDMPGGNPKYQDPPSQPVAAVNGNGRHALTADDLASLEAHEAESRQMARHGDHLFNSISVDLDTIVQDVSALRAIYAEREDAFNDRQDWQALAEEYERRVTELTAERDEAVARAERAEGRLAILRSALSGE